MSDRSEILSIGGFVAVSTLAVTVAFYGVLAILEGGNPGFRSRFPFYILVLTVSFTALVIVLERYLAKGDRILVTSVVLSVTVAVLVTLDVEGVIYAASQPDELVASRSVLYLIAAGCLCTGLVYWGVHHWREFVSGPDT